MSLTKNPDQPVTGAVRAFLKRWGISVGSRIVVGYSGGPDSTALLYSLMALKDELTLSLCCAYLNHGLREESEIKRETELIGRTTSSCGVECVRHDLAGGYLADRARALHCSLEDLARRERYRFFRQVLSQKQYDYIALGHTADDQAETIIMRVFQGSGPQGVSGIKARRERIIRPLLSCTRRNILEYLAAIGADYIEDSSNKNPRFLRNRVRHELIPVIGSIFPGFRRALTAFQEKNIYADDFIRQAAEQRKEWRRSENGCSTQAADFFSLAPALRLYVLYRLIDHLMGPDKPVSKTRIPYRFLRPLLETGRLPGRGILLRGFGLVVYRKGGRLFLERDVVVPVKKDYVITIKPDILYTVDGKKAKFTCLFTARAQDDSTFSLAAEKISWPLILRTRRDGDRIDFGWGHKKLKKLFNELNMAPAERGLIPVLADKKGIVAVIGTVAGLKNFFRKGVAIKDNLHKNVLHCIIHQAEQ
jgi:tRNA(Ile)-lysidine synthase